jgi:hypothetical protein
MLGCLAAMVCACGRGGDASLSGGLNDRREVAVLPVLPARPDGGVESFHGCPASEAFYDRLFASDEIEATIAFGYLDQHLDGVLDYLRYSLLKLDPIPVFLTTQQSLLAEIRSTFLAKGFVEDASSRTQLDLSRGFYYRGRPKTLRLHVLFSVARCADEAPDEHGRLWRFDDQTCPEQQRTTLLAKTQFIRAFAKSSIIMYHGHARQGGGLDFGPMGLPDGKVSVDCASLPCREPGPPQIVLFLNACDTADLYGRAVAKVRAGLGSNRTLAWLATRGNMVMGNAGESSARLLDMLVETRCPSEILTVMNLPKRYLDGDSRVVAEGF